MTSPRFVEESTIDLSEVKSILEGVDKRDEELNYRSNKTKEFLDSFCGALSDKHIVDLRKKLVDLNLTRLKEEHIVKIVDFLPTTAQDLKVVLQAYPLSLPKKDQDAIIDAVKGFV